jgi:acetolactate synthase-1/2/3 large subunit
MQVADYISRCLTDFGVRHVFMVTGGGAMFLNHAIGTNPQIETVFCHHEQACAMAAEGYTRIAGIPGVIIVTTGPGGINALNGVFGAWVDSIPMLIISGQVKRESYLRYYDLPNLRQLGDQEADILSMVKGITKYAVTVFNPPDIRYHLEKAWHLAISGRPGPCWLDIPIDVQSSTIDPDSLTPFDPKEEQITYDADLPGVCGNVLQRIINAKRPVIMAGKGIRLANALEEYEQFIRSFSIPIVPGWTSIDLIADNDPLFCGRPGDLGTRAGNFTVQNADVLLILGTRLGLRQVSYNWKSFAREAYKIQVDIDQAEFNKPTVKPDLAVHCDLKSFFIEINRQVAIKRPVPDSHKEWLSWCRQRVRRYPVVSPDHRKRKEKLINPYYFVEELTSNLRPDDVVICGNGTANVVAFQASIIQKGQRFIANTGDASMGYDLPAAIGACFARGEGRVICLSGDGSLQLNIQELQTVFHHQLPVKLFVLDNQGYLSIRLSQQNMFGQVIGEGPASGISFPDIIKVAQAYGLPAIRIGYDELRQGIQQVLGTPGPIVCDVLLDPDQPFEPRIASRKQDDGKIVSSPLEDMFPFLSTEELKENLFIPCLR